MRAHRVDRPPTTTTEGPSTPGYSSGLPLFRWPRTPHRVTPVVLRRPVPPTQTYDPLWSYPCVSFSSLRFYIDLFLLGPPSTTRSLLLVIPTSYSGFSDRFPGLLSIPPPSARSAAKSTLYHHSTTLNPATPPPVPVPDMWGENFRTVLYLSLYLLSSIVLRTSGPSQK